jgi:antitoxin VapB
VIVATMNIKDPAVRELAEQLAARRHTTMTDAVRQALTETLDRDRASRQGLADRLMAIGEEFRARGGTVLTDDDLYDERGLPK